MRADPEAAIMHKCRELILLLNIHLNHFPKHEKYGLCQTIRNCVYGVMGLIVECQKKYHNKTSLTKLDVQHEQLRAFVNLAFEMGYFSYHDNKRASAGLILLASALGARQDLSAKDQCITLVNH